MNAQQEIAYYDQAYEADQRYQRSDPHGEIITDDELLEWKKHWENIDQGE
jgi:hypothetical protein